MKRFNHEYFGPGDDVGGNMNEAEDGDYVLYAEAEAAITKLEAALAAADAAAIETIRELTYANEQRRQVIDALERKLEEAASLALANGMRADSAERRIAKADALLREWCNFDFDCPDEEDGDEDGEALLRLGDKTASYLRKCDSEREDAT